MKKRTAQGKALILSLFSILITFSSFVFVMWQTFRCITKYVQNPQGTTLSIENTARLPFPAITVCANPGYIENELAKCGSR